MTILDEIHIGGGEPVAGGQRVQDAAVERHAIAPVLRQKIDEWILPLRTAGTARLDGELGERLRRIAPMQQCFCVLADHGCAGLEPLPPRLHGTMAEEMQRLYATLLIERDPLLTRAGQEWCALIDTIEAHCHWIRQNTRNAEVLLAWLTRVAADGANHLAIVPARGWLSRGALFAFFSQRPADAAVFALFYATQRLAVTLELPMRRCPSMPISLSRRWRE